MLLLCLARGFLIIWANMGISRTFGRFSRVRRFIVLWEILYVSSLSYSRAAGSGFYSFFDLKDSHYRPSMIT